MVIFKHDVTQTISKQGVNVKSTFVKRAATVLLAAFSIFNQSTAFGETTYLDRNTFASVVGTQITDTFAAATYGYAPGGSLVLTDSAMSAAFGQTRFQSTAYSQYNGINIVGSIGAVASEAYCAGCNGSFLLSFADTSLSTSSGIFAAGVDVVYTERIPYHAFVTFGDGSTSNYQLPSVLAFQPSIFWGVSSDKGIKSIHFGEINGGVTRRDAFAIDNLTIATAVTAVPEPETYALMLAGLGLMGTVARCRSAKQNQAPRN